MSPFFVYVLNTVGLWSAVGRVIYASPKPTRGALRASLVLVLGYADLIFLLWQNCALSSVFAWGMGCAVAATGMPREPFVWLDEKWNGLRFVLYLLSVGTMSGLAYVHLPIGTFLTSPGEIGVHLDYLTTNNARRAVGIVYVAALVYALALSPRMKATLTVLALGMSAMTLAYSYILPFGYPMMSGLMFEQIPIPRHTLILRGLADLAVLLLAGAAIVIFLSRWGGRSLALALGLVNMSLLVSSHLRIARDLDVQAGGADRAEHSQMLRFSTQSPNVLIIMLDRFMGGFVEKILATEPELADRLDGFTWYPKTMAAGVNSIAGAHPIFGGYDYTPREMNARGLFLRDLSVEAYRILPLNFSAKGYEVNFVNPRGLGFTMAGDCSFLDIAGVNCTHVPLAISTRMAKENGVSLAQLSESNYADLLALLGIMRAAPYALKGAVHQLGPWKPFLDHSAGTTFREWAELKSLPTLTTFDAAAPTLNIVWSILPHEPYFMGEDCKPRGKRLKYSKLHIKKRGNSSLFELQHEVAARCSLLLVADYMEHLKVRGAYDTSKIVVVSDHGILGPAKDRSSRALAGNTSENIYVSSRSVLLVKQENAHGQLKASDQFMPNAEVPRLVCEQIGGCTNPYLGNKAIATEGRDDPFYVDMVPWQFSEQEPNAFVITRELSLSGKEPYDSKKWDISEKSQP